MESIKAFLAGKKTYLVAASVVLGAIVAYSGGEADLGQTIQAIITAVLGATIRAGIGKVE